jgi:hypothetical protein
MSSSTACIALKRTKRGHCMLFTMPRYTAKNAMSGAKGTVV